MATPRSVGSATSPKEDESFSRNGRPSQSFYWGVALASHCMICFNQLEGSNFFAEFLMHVR